MRYLYLFFLMICLVSCRTKSKLTSAIATKVDKSICPEAGSCLVEILKNKTLKIKNDNLGSMYPEIVNGNHFVVKYEYKKNEKANYEDSSYREEVFIELDKENLEFETTDLKSKKLFFARWCYCKGQTGYYKINHGKLSISKIDNQNFNLHLSFKIDEVPQILNEINYTFNLD